MPSLLGAPNNRYRLFFLILCFIFLYFWNRREQTYGDEIRRRDEKLEAVQREHASVLEKLRVIWLHKKKIESDAKQQKADLDKFQSKFKLKESEIYGYRTKNKDCLTELSSCQKDSKDEKDEKPNQETTEKLKIEVSGLKKKVDEMEEKMKEMENDSASMAAILKDELKQCEAKIRQLTGGGAIEHYSQNETAHFMRAQKANEPLFFDRGNIQHHRPEKLLRGKQLAETLEDARARKMEEKQQLDKHPQDRENKDQEVNEQPDQGEQDYKEH